jgi:hypothetical protein
VGGSFGVAGLARCWCARAGAVEPVSGRRSGGSTAVSEGGETDERDPLVSDHAERRARARRPHGPSQWAACTARLWAAARAVRAGDRSQADLGHAPVGRLRNSVAFLFPFCLKLLDV